MLRADDEIYVAVVASTVLMLLLTGVIAMAVVRYQNKARDLYRMQQAYERTLLQAQLEIQNQTLAQVGRDLHDHIGQLLSVAMLHLNGLDEELDNTDHRYAIRQTIQVVGATIQDVRALSKTLDSDTIRRFGLRPGLELELDRIERTGRYQTQLHVVGQPYPLGEQAEIILFRLAQESINNAIKHAGGQRILVTTDYAPDRFTLTISDDGHGFDVAEATGRHLAASGSGLRNLHQRAGLLGGTCSIRSGPAAGTTVTIRLPHTVT